VLSIDSSAEALALGRSNAELNGLNPESMRWRCDDVFEQLRACRDAGEQFDLIVLDPPKFAASHHHVERAARAYKDINLKRAATAAAGRSADDVLMLRRRSTWTCSRRSSPVR